MWASTHATQVSSYNLKYSEEFLQIRYGKVKKHMKGCSTSLFIREKQIRTTIQCHFIPTGMARISNKTKWKIFTVGKDVEKLEALYIGGGNVNGVAVVENGLTVPQEVKDRITIWSSNSTPKSISKGPENVSSNKSWHNNKSSPVHYMAQRWEQPNCPSMDKCMNKMRHIHTIHL